MLTVPVGLFTILRVTANHVLIKQHNKEYNNLFSRSLHFIRSETAFNLLLGGISGIAQYYHEQTNWEQFDTPSFLLPVVILGSITTELVLNLMPEIHALYIQKGFSDKRLHGYKKLLAEVTLPSAVAGTVIAPILYYIHPTYTIENFLLTTLGVQIGRQISIGLVEHFNEKNSTSIKDRKDEEMKSAHSESESLLSTSSEDDNLATSIPQETSASIVFTGARALLATATTVGTVAIALYLCGSADNEQDQYNTSTLDINLNAALGATIGLFSTAAVAVTGTLLGYCAHGFFKRADETITAPAPSSSAFSLN